MSSSIGNEENVEIELLQSPEKNILEDPFQEKIYMESHEFWEEVHARIFNDGFSNEKAILSTRVKWLTNQHAEAHPGDDVLVHLLTEVTDNYRNKYYENEKENDVKGYHHPNFVQELTNLVVYILEKDYGSDWKTNVFCILKLATERSLSQIIMYLVQLCPQLSKYLISLCEAVDSILLKITGNTYQSKPYLRKQTDESASFLIKLIPSHIIREKFKCGVTAENYRFRDFLNSGYYEKTCIAILDCMVDAHGPVLKSKENQLVENGYTSAFWKLPVQFRFHYHIFENSLIYKETLVLQCLVENSRNKDITTHPVVRSYVERKWLSYGQYITLAHASYYILFLVVLSIALFTQPLYRKSTTYEGSVDTLRAFCEICTLIFTFCLLISEMAQLSRKKGRYFHEIENYFDLYGIFSIILIIPLRYSNNHDVEFIIAGIGFAINFTRVIKFFPVSEQLGIYIETISNIISYDITKFFAVFSIVIFGYVGMVFLVLKGLEDIHLVGGFWKIFLKILRALVEGKEFDDEYYKYHLFAIIILMLVMAAILVVLLNLLIGQISYRYAEAQTSASISYNFNKCVLLVKAEKSILLRYCFKALGNKVSRPSIVEDRDKVIKYVGDWMKVKSKYEDEESQKSIKDYLIRDVLKVESR